MEEHSQEPLLGPLLFKFAFPVIRSISGFGKGGKKILLLCQAVYSGKYFSSAMIEFGRDNYLILLEVLNNEIY